MPPGFREYYDREWEIKLRRPEYATFERRWRSRWDFARRNIRRGSRVLDAACGDGVLGKFLIEESDCEVHGLDISDYALKLARERGVLAECCDISSERFPHSDNSFDVVTLLCCLEHVLDPIHTMSEAHRVVRQGGHIIVTLPNAVYFWNRVWFLFGRISNDLLHINPGEGMHIQFYNFKDEFEKRVLSQIKGLSTEVKKPDLKNPLKYSFLGRTLLYLLMKPFPNMFAQYTHWIFKKEV